MSLTVVYDACVLYPAPLRSFLLYLAMTGLYRARWTNDIHEEWMRSVQRDYPDVTRRQAEKIRDLMNAHVADCLVTGYEAIVPSLALPDSDDRHVLAAAICCEADIILTFNLNPEPYIGNRDRPARPFRARPDLPTRCLAILASARRGCSA